MNAKTLRPEHGKSSIHWEFVPTKCKYRIGQQRLTVQRTQAQTMDMTIKCPSCGYDNRDEANYCVKCGVRIVAPAIHQMPQAGGLLPTTATEAPMPTRCSFHPMATATYLCNRCGRPLCRSCVRPSFGMVLCPLCWTGPVQPYPWLPHPLTRPPYPVTFACR